MMSKDQRETERDRYEKRTEERKLHPRWHLGQRDPIAMFTGWLVICTFLLSVVTAISVIVLVITDRTLDKTFVATTRAWIAPTGAKVDGSIRAGTSFRVKIFFENSGKEPANHMQHVWAWSEIPVKIDAAGVPYIGVQETPWPTQILNCAGNVTIAGRPVYPGIKNENIHYIFNGNPSFVPETLVKKNQVS